MKLIDRTLFYHTDEITIRWNQSKCIHAGICYSRLRSVFDPVRRPWIDAKAAPAAEIIAVIEACPSGALSYVRKGDPTPEEGE